MVRKKTQDDTELTEAEKNASRNDHHLSKCENDVSFDEVDSIFSFLLILDFARLMDAIDNIFAHYKTVANQKLKALPPSRF